MTGTLSSVDGDGIAFLKLIYLFGPVELLLLKHVSIGYLFIKWTKFNYLA